MKTWLIVLAIVALGAAGLHLWRWRGHRQRISLATQEHHVVELQAAARWMLVIATICFVVATAALFWAYATTEQGTDGAPPPAETAPPAPSP